MAEVFNDWLPTVIQEVKPWYSSDIEKGIRWGSEITSQLQDTKLGLICLTSENLNSPWILFEAGALSKTLDKTYVCPYLLDINPVELQGPLSQFQATSFNKDDTRKLLNTINKALEGDALEPRILEKQFKIWWPELENKLNKILAVDKNAKRPKRDDREILEEILLIVRSFTYTNEHLVSRIQQAFPHLSQEELNQMMGSLIKWLADGIGTDNQPARLTRNKDGTMSIRVLSFENEPRNLNSNMRKKQKKSNWKLDSERKG